MRIQNASTHRSSRSQEQGAPAQDLKAAIRGLVQSIQAMVKDATGMADLFEDGAGRRGAERPGAGGAKRAREAARRISERAAAGTQRATERTGAAAEQVKGAVEKGQQGVDALLTQGGAYLQELKQRAAEGGSGGVPALSDADVEAALGELDSLQQRAGDVLENTEAKLARIADRQAQRAAGRLEWLDKLEKKALAKLEAKGEGDSAMAERLSARFDKLRERVQKGADRAEKAVERAKSDLAKQKDELARAMESMRAEVEALRGPSPAPSPAPNPTPPPGTP